MEKLSCTKRCFQSRDLAKKEAKRINQHGKAAKKITDVYYCEQCSAWHMTSLGKQRSRDLTRKNRKEK